jgi:peptide/nickel transport system permease protein
LTRPRLRPGERAAQIDPAIARFILKRLGLALITLWILSVIIFGLSQLLPGDVGRQILGPLADPRSVAVLDHKLGVDKPWYVQYWNWVTGLLHGDLGKSLTFGVPVRPAVTNALEHSLKLGAEAFAIVVPISILGGVVAALRYGKPTDRLISVVGLSASSIPEFVSSFVLISIFTVWLGWLPFSADPGPGASVLTQIKYLILPSLPLVLVLFGYIARMARAGTVEALDSDYSRTAYLKGLGRGVVVRRHVLRNGLLPTITVVATQVGYLIGGLVVVETIFNYPGIGQLIYTAAKSKDFPTLEAGVLTVGAVYLVATLLGDILTSLLNPRIRYPVES